jgi:hypothetical protein
MAFQDFTARRLDKEQITRLAARLFLKGEIFSEKKAKLRLVYGNTKEEGETVVLYRWIEGDRERKYTLGTVESFPSEKSRWKEVVRLGLDRQIDPRTFEELIHHWLEKECPGDVWRLTLKTLPETLVSLCDGSIRRDQAAVTMWLCAGLTSAKGALLSLRSTAGWTRNSKGLLWVSFSYHGAKDNAKTPLIWMFNFGQL